MTSLRRMLALVLIMTLLIDGVKAYAASLEPVESFQLYLPIVLNERLPSPFDLIEQAEQAGKLSEDAALLYRVYATIDASQLPAEYRGDNSPRTHHPNALRAAARRYKTAAPDLQAKLAPYLVPPIYAGSWWDIRTHGHPTIMPVARNMQPSHTAEDPQVRCDRVLGTDWFAVEGQHAKVWHVNDPAGQAAAQLIASEMESVIWPKLTALMGVEPLSDTNYLCNGGDGRLDIYVAPINVYNASGSLGFTSTDDCGLAPYIFIKATQPLEDVGDIAAHEFMHTLQDRYLGLQCDGYDLDADDWLKESTATWSESYLYPNHIHKASLWQTFGQSYLRQYAYDDMVTSDSTSWYAAYLFPYYLTHQFNDPSIIRKMFGMMQTHETLNAVNLAIPGGFAERWPEFARYNLNIRDLNHYEQWDGLQGGVLQSSRLFYIRGDAAQLGPAKPNAIWRIPALQVLQTLSAQYVLAKGLTETVHSVLFDHPASIETEPTYRLEAQLLYEKGGAPSNRVQQDWTHLPFPFVCVDDVDLASGNELSDIILIASNSNHESGWVSPDFSYARIILSTLPCNTFSGSTTLIHQVSIDAPTYTSFTTQQIVAQATFKRVGATLFENRLALGFRPISGTLTLNWSTTITTKGSGGQTVVCGGGPHHAAIGQSASEVNSLLTISETLGSPATRSYFANAATPMKYTDVDCFGQDFTVDEPTTWLTMGLIPQPMSTGSDLIAGTYSMTHTEAFATGTDFASWMLSAP